MRSFAALVLLGGVSAWGAVKEAPVTLFVDTSEIEGAPKNELVTGSAFELRFNEPMVADDAVGKPGSDAPIVLKPAIAGTWTWVSNQSGVYQLTEPPALGSSVQVTLRGDLQNAAGKAFRAALKDTFTAPKFRVKGWNAEDYWDATDATAKPKFGVCFPAEVDAEGAAKQMWFTNDTKVRVAATAEYMDIRKTHDAFPAYRADDKNNLTWVEDFREYRAAGAKTKSNTTDNVEDGDAPVQKGGPVFKNQLVVTPAQPLPAGTGWKLIVGQGLSSVDGTKLSADVPIDVGTIRPFAVTRVTPENLVYTGKRVVLEFSKPLSKEARKDPAKIIKVEPAVANLKVEPPKDVYDDRKQLLLTGDFELAKDYTITVAGETTAQEPFTLGQPASKVVSFSPVPSRLYFQEFATHQQRGGTRQFHLMGVNVRNVKVSAKVLPTEHVTAALEAYAKYYKEGGADNSEWLQKVDDKAIPATTVWQKDFSLETTVDQKKLLAFSWDEILGAGKNGVVLLTAEQASSQAPNVKRVGAQALVQVTDLGLVWKDGGDLFFHGFSLANAQPVAGASLTLLDEAGQVLGTTKLAADGTGRLPKKKKEGKKRGHSRNGCC